MCHSAEMMKEILVMWRGQIRREAMMKNFERIRGEVSTGSQPTATRRVLYSEERREKLEDRSEMYPAGGAAAPLYTTPMVAKQVLHVL